MANPETTLTNRIRKKLVEHYPDAWIVKVAGGPFQTGGIPDLIMCVNGLLIGLEVKDPKPGEKRSTTYRRTTRRQLATINSIRSAGGHAGVVLDEAGALAIVEFALRKVS